jgi:hypothetical protein
MASSRSLSSLMGCVCSYCLSGVVQGVVELRKQLVVRGIIDGIKSGD